MANYVIAIDGPAGSGKGTVAKLAAQKLGFHYLDTGAMYRAVTLYIKNENIDINDQAAITAAAQRCSIEFKLSEDMQEQYVMLNGNDVTDEIRSTDISCMVAPICSVAGVRNHLVTLQRNAGEISSVIMDGRDIGTVVYPDADLKIYLTATIDERVRRRQLQYKEKGIEVEFEKLKQDMSQRDMIDTSREHSPLKKAPDAVVIESDGMSIEQVVDKIIELFNNRVKQ